VTAANVTNRGFGLFLGKKRSRPVPTLVITVLVTCLVAIPLGVVALDARDNPTTAPAVVAPADAGLIVVDMADADSQPLDLSTISGSVLISVTDAEASSVAFSLFAAGADTPVVASQDLDGPQFDLVVSDSGGADPFDSNLLVDGDYELFVTIRTDSEDRRTAVAFSVENS